MNEIKRIDTVQQYNDYFGMETLHPLVTVIDARCYLDERPGLWYSQIWS